MIADLTPYPKYKVSGSTQIGLLPIHWALETLRRCLRAPDGIKIGPFGSQLKLAEMLDSGFKVYGQANVISGDVRKGSKFVSEVKFRELQECEVRPGDLLVTMMGTSGRCLAVPDFAQRGIMDSHLLRLRTDSTGLGNLFAALIIGVVSRNRRNFRYQPLIFNLRAS